MEEAARSTMTLYQFAGFLSAHSAHVRRITSHQFYQYLARLDRRGDVTLMNYGYTSLDPQAPPLPLDPADEPNRLCLQMYHHVASPVDLRGKDVLEVGSGRGGGASYVKRYLRPRTMTGVDYSARAVEFCQRTHRVEGLRYVHGDAESLPLDGEQFDAVVNVESSHCYGDMGRFLREAHRVLRPGGHLLWADHRPPHRIDALHRDIRRAGFAVIKEETITTNVLAALADLGKHYRALIDQGVPRLARRIFYDFAGVEGTHIHRQLQSGALVYLHLALCKQS
jgi:ubiquinone/menaquinone biosynthesis C-methylase UbiE